MNERQKKAVELFFSGCNCCQAVAAVFCEKYDIPQTTVLRLGAAFGGGMRRKEVCGAVSGALMALGMKFGQDRVDDKEARALADAKTAEFMNEYEKRHGSYLCRDLLADKYWRNVCDGFVAGAVELAEEFGV